MKFECISSVFNCDHSSHRITNCANWFATLTSTSLMDDYGHETAERMVNISLVNYPF